MTLKDDPWTIPGMMLVTGSNAPSVGTTILFVVGLMIGALYQVFFGTIFVALGVVLLAIRVYLGSRVLTFVAFATVASGNRLFPRVPTYLVCYGA